MANSTTYEITASLDGFAPQKRSQITLNVGQELTFDFVLKVGGVQEAVTVVAPAAILETTKNTIGSIVKKEQIDELPVVSRDFSDLAKLAPGVTPGSGGNTESLSFNGQRDSRTGSSSMARPPSGSTTVSNRRRSCRTGFRNSR
jgi:hypothetical protein